MVLSIIWNRLPSEYRTSGFLLSFFLLLASFLMQNFAIVSLSMVVEGIVCKKNVAHRRMTTRIEKPRLMILGGALEYQRVSNLLSSFDTLLQQVLRNYFSRLILLCLFVCVFVRRIWICNFNDTQIILLMTFSDHLPNCLY